MKFYYIKDVINLICQFMLMVTAGVGDQVHSEKLFERK